MHDFASLLQQSTAHAWLFLPTAVLLGALHGLEPGHSKTMMAAFIIAIRGTIGQAVLLGVCAAFSHSLVVWALAAGALFSGQHWNIETSEPYFQIGSGLLVLATALWMAWCTYRDVQAEAAHHHAHDPAAGFLIDTGHGHLNLSIFENGVPPRFEIHFSDPGAAAAWNPAAASIEITRPDGSRQSFGFQTSAATWISTASVPEPHEFTALLTLGHGGHEHSHPLTFSAHDPVHLVAGHSPDSEYQDAHERAHAQDIEKRFAHRQATPGQIILFGLSGGLLPCPAAFSILILCLQLKQFTLGFTLVLCFSVGLALTLVASGTLAAWGVRHATRKIKGFSAFARHAPFLSSAVLTLLGTYLIIRGLRVL